MRTKTPCASPAVERGASATSFGGRESFGGTQTWGRHVPCQPQAMRDKSFRLGPRAPRFHEGQNNLVRCAFIKPTTSPEARKSESGPSPPKGGEGGRRPDEGGLRVPTTDRVPHQKPPSDSERSSPATWHSPGWVNAKWWRGAVRDGVCKYNAGCPLTRPSGTLSPLPGARDLWGACASPGDGFLPP